MVSLRRVKFVPVNRHFPQPSHSTKEHNMTVEKVLYTAEAVATGGREGRAVSSDKALDVQLSTPRELGGAGGPGTNPEQLFAAGYSACFLGALKFVASQDKVALPAATQITGKV